jgi:hypothetical protein
MEYDPKRLVESGYDCVAQRYLEFAQQNLLENKSLSFLWVLAKKAQMNKGLQTVS